MLPNKIFYTYNYNMTSELQKKNLTINFETLDDGQAYLNKIGIYIVWGSFL